MKREQALEEMIVSMLIGAVVTMLIMILLDVDGKLEIIYTFAAVWFCATAAVWGVIDWKGGRKCGD